MDDLAARRVILATPAGAAPPRESDAIRCCDGRPCHWRFDPEGEDTRRSARSHRAQIKKQSTKVALILGSPHPKMAGMLTDAPTRAADFVCFLALRFILLSGFTLDGFGRSRGDHAALDVQRFADDEA